jgi:predicted deacylase
MKTTRHALTPPTPGTRRELLSLQYGTPGGAKAVVQASLHADEVPAMLVAHHLRIALAQLEAQGRIRGEIVLVPYANPVGLSQRALHGHVGRFELGSGENFNRHYPDLAPRVADLVRGRLGDDAATNVALVREAARRACAEQRADGELASLRRTLLQLAIDADLVLDLHSDNEAVLHLYTSTPSWNEVEPLARLLGAEVSLLATRSGGEPFDEACSMLWPLVEERLRAAGEHVALPHACIAVTVELRGETDVDHALAQRDAAALLRYLALRGFVEGGEPGPLPELRGEALPLAGSIPVVAPAGGVLVPRQPVGARVRRGEPIADLVDPDAGTATPVPSPCDGVLYARELRRVVYAGQRIAKVAGREPVRTGELLSA